MLLSNMLDKIFLYFEMLPKIEDALLCTSNSEKFHSLLILNDVSWQIKSTLLPKLLTCFYLFRKWTYYFHTFYHNDITKKIWGLTRLLQPVPPRIKRKTNVWNLKINTHKTGKKLVCTDLNFCHLNQQECKKWTNITIWN